MAKLLQLFSKQLSRFWNFIGTCFMMFWRYWHRGTIHKYDVGGLLQWQKEEIRRLEEILNGNEVLNKKQCKHVLTTLKKVVECVGEMIPLSSEVQEFGVALEELCYITQKLGVVVSECGNQNQRQAIVFQINNKEAFRELVSDLRCCWDVINEIHSTSHLGLHSVMSTIDLDLPTLQDIEDDEKALQETLKDGSNYEWKEYLLRRLGDLQLEGGELDGVEVPNVIDSLKPKLLKQIGEGGFGAVYESVWLGFQCATKILLVRHGISIFCKEVGILAGLSHPNLIKFIYCGVGWSKDELCSWTLKVLRKWKCFIEMFYGNGKVLWKGGNGQNDKNLYLVMEFMDMSLSGMLKKQSKLLSYLLAIDIMHQIASGVCYLHDMHVVHLDLKPDNVLMRTNSIKLAKLNSSRYLVKLVDYGTSKIDVQSKVSEKQKCNRVGTTWYTAPGIMQEESHASLFRADVWSFAMTCSEILSQTALFDNVKPRDILDKIKEYERPQLPMNCKELTRLIEECWVEDPLQRPTFFEICDKLIDLKKMFLRGTYLASLRPEFEKDGALLQRNSRIEKAKEVKEKHIIEVNEATMPKKNMVVGLERNLTKVKDRLKEVTILALIGMGGIGKTTLANAIYHELKSAYNASYFAKDLKNKSDPFGILCDMLEDFVKDPKSLPIDLGDAQNMLKQFVVGKKVLMILDDIRDQVQLDNLVHPNILRDNAGITLIITTRHWDKIKDRVQENGKIEVDTLDENAAKQFFIHHSCGVGGSLQKDFDGIGGRIVEACSGLPLSLGVLGDFLWDENRLRSWERALQRIKRGRCLDGDKEEGTKLWSTLRISFDGLGMEEKNMFLDIACFFCKDIWPEGMSKDRALHVWTSNDTPPIQSFNMLIERSLVNVDKNGHIEMHDQLRDMGRMIVERDGDYLGTRVWIVDSILSTQSTREGTKKVQSLLYKRLQCHLQGQNDCLDLDLSNLRLLFIHDHINNASTDFQLFKLPFSNDQKYLHQLEAIFINGNFQRLPKQLWELHSLKFFDIEGSETLEALHEGLGNLTSVTHLNFTRCKRLETLPEELGNLTSLRELHLTGCSSLTTLPKGLGNLSSLTDLHLWGCSSLKILPEGLGNLTSLRKLNLWGCWISIKVPGGLWNLASLPKLKLHDLSCLTTILEGFGNLTFLTELNLSKCSNLTTLPKVLGNLTCLMELNLSSCSSLTILPEGFGNLTSLTSLDLSNCSSLTTLPEGLGNLLSLTLLDLSNCSSLTTLSEGLGNLISLTDLHLWGCSSLTTLPSGLGNLISLTKLDLSDCSRLATLPEGLGNLTSLTRLYFSKCSSLTTLPEGLRNLTSLMGLNLHECSRLRTLPEGLGNLTSLTELTLSNCSSLTTLPEGLGNLTSLTMLDLSKCSNLTTLPKVLGNLTCLMELNLSSCSSLTILPEGLGNLTSLMKLDFPNCSNLTTLPEGLGNLISLTLLDLSNCSSLTTLFEGFGNLISLTDLHLWGCSSLNTLPRGLGNLISLTKLNLSDCSRLITLPEGLGNLTSLITLYVSKCSSLTTLPEGFQNLTCLTGLNLHECSRLRTLPEGLGNFTSLTELTLSNCSSLTTLPKGLGNLTSLTMLDMSNCSRLTTLPEGLGNLTSLTMLDLSNCSRLTTLPEGLGNLTSLALLDLSHCLSLTTLPKGLGNLTSLTKLYLSYCSSLTTLPRGLGNLTSLTKFYLSYCSSSTKLPEGLGNLTSLTELTLSNCSRLTTLPEGLINLTSLMKL